MKGSNSNLPPVGPNNKVSKRSKTASFKRPMSCEVGDIAPQKKSGFFNNILRKGSSNTKLNDDIVEDDKPPASLPQKAPHFQGRNFDSDDDDCSDEDTHVTASARYFDIENNTQNSAQRILSNPALFAALLEYTFNGNKDYNSLLYYQCVQLYKMFSSSKEFSKEAQRHAYEILTTFLHPLSPLKVDHIGNIDTILINLKNNNNMSSIFDDSAQEVLEHCIKESIIKLHMSITHGLFTLLEKFKTIQFDSQLSSFNECIDSITKKFYDKIPKIKSDNQTQEDLETERHLNDVLNGIKSALASIYFYYSKRDKDESSDTTSISSKSRSVGLGRSTESLQFMNGCIIDKQPLFCGKQRKNYGHSIFKKAKVFKGHHFNEKSFEFPAVCLFCEKLLWGIAPQGFLCSHCNGSVHKHCKDLLRDVCTKQDQRRYQRNYSSISPVSTDEMMKNESYGDRSSTHELSYDSLSNPQDYTENSSDTIDKEGPTETPDLTSISTTSINLVSNSQISKQPSCISTTSIVISPSDDCNTDKTIVTHNSVTTINSNSNSMVYPSTNDFDNESTDKFFDSNNSIDVSRADSTPRSDKKSYVKNITHMYDQRAQTSITRSHSEESMDNKSLPRSKRQSELVNVQDLVQDQNIWSNDPDMQVQETFEADVELKEFPNYLTKDQDRAEYTRLLVLLEFYHKIKFTVMSLKRFDYLLIQKWPENDKLLFKTLRLNCIIPLYELIKNLVEVIDGCKTDVSFASDTAEKVVAWFKNNKEENLQNWLGFSIDLCCTNSLQAVKAQWREMKRNDLQFNRVLNVRYNKIFMVEQLSNMRPLLFNLPLIINKVIRDLSKYSKYKTEIKSWKEIHEKFKLLPKYIDERCMPLVDLINNGTIINSFDRSGWMGRISNREPFFDYFADFPKTAFHYKLFDMQYVKISNFRESGKASGKISGSPAIFVKEITEAYALCYDNMMVLLQKENDKYVLKQFKATDTSKTQPLLVFDNVHASYGQLKVHELTIVFISVAVLTQIQFTSDTIMKNWYDFISAHKHVSPNNPNTTFSDNGRHYSLSGNSVKMPSDNLTENITINNDTADISISQIEETLPNKHDENIKDLTKDVKLMSGNDLFIEPINDKQCLLGTMQDSLTLLRYSMELINTSTTESVSVSSLPDKSSNHLEESTTSHILAIIDRMKSRVNNHIDHSAALHQTALSSDDTNADFNSNNNNNNINDDYEIKPEIIDRENAFESCSLKSDASNTDYPNISGSPTASNQFNHSSHGDVQNETLSLLETEPVQIGDHFIDDFVEEIINNAVDQIISKSSNDSDSNARNSDDNLSTVKISDYNEPQDDIISTTDTTTFNSHQDVINDQASIEMTMP